MKDNLLIATWMGGKPCDRCDDCGMIKFGESDYRSLYYLRYHSDWNLLMGVLEKINTYQSPSWQRDIMVNGTTLVLITLDIEKTYLAVVNFINWHNSLQP